jgi:hypothetical protein
MVTFLYRFLLLYKVTYLLYKFTTCSKDTRALTFENVDQVFFKYLLRGSFRKIAPSDLTKPGPFAREWVETNGIFFVIFFLYIFFPREWVRQSVYLCVLYFFGYLFLAREWVETNCIYTRTHKTHTRTHTHTHTHTHRGELCYVWSENARKQRWLETRLPPLRR